MCLKKSITLDWLKIKRGLVDKIHRYFILDYKEPQYLDT